MTFLDGCLCGRSQLLMIPRRELLQKIASAALLFFVPRSQPVNLTPEKYPKSQFCIGDKVADYWTNEFDKECVEYGEVLGFCWHPYEQTWAYLVNWTGGQGPDSTYPCFDERLVVGGDLRLVSHD
ncbi:hypothetical protein QUB36_20530 [Microcoleus sp. AT8-B1]|uniref:hypothetical protein n=1 Tax=unclassified Microcoleus TaxID=2642155 RepID=UPI002FD59011